MMLSTNQSASSFISSADENWYFSREEEKSIASVLLQYIERKYLFA